MPRDRRYFESWCCYEVTFRARTGLPLVANYLMRFLLSAILARVQRDDKVILCHDIWNGSHPHLIVVALDAKNLEAFYREIQKKITDVIKRLLGLKYLRLWEGRPNVAKVDSIADGEDRIAYLYANPAQDDLETCIEKFPGLSSWRDYQKCLDRLNGETSEKYPWVRLPSIPKLDNAAASDSECRAIARLLRSRNKKKSHTLVRKFNLWMKCFGVTEDSEVREINERIEKKLRLREAEAMEKRIRKNKQVMGAAALLAQPIMKYHVPKKHERKICILAHDKVRRIAFIRHMKRFNDRCRECYECWKRGDITVVWPAGAFKPPMPPSYNILPMFD